MCNISDEYAWLIRKGAFTTRDVDKLRNHTPVGASIKFRIKSTKTYASDYGVEYQKTIKGVVAAKYPHIFMLDDGRTFMWKDYLLGKVN